MNTFPSQGSIALIGPSAGWPEAAQLAVGGVHPADRWDEQAPETLPTMAQIRQLQVFASRSSRAGRKVALLYRADSFPREVGNALLKLLEEPPPSLLIVLFSETDRLLATVRSRVTRLAVADYSASPNGAPGLSAWQRQLAAVQTDSPRQREEARQLLYWQSLFHSGLKPDSFLQTHSLS